MCTSNAPNNFLFPENNILCFSIVYKSEIHQKDLNEGFSVIIHQVSWDIWWSLIHGWQEAVRGQTVMAEVTCLCPLTSRDQIIGNGWGHLFVSSGL